MHINDMIPSGLNDQFLMDLKDWFKSYVAGFSDEDPEIHQNLDIKIDHTYRVCEEIIHLGRELGLKDEALRLAEAIALLHDVGRFEQYVSYRTFKDSESEDHAGLGLKVIKEQNLLKGLDPVLADIIVAAIRHHNRLALPANENDPRLFYEKLIRDADKLDIWHVVLSYYYRKDGSKNRAIELDFPDTPEVSAHVLDDLRNRRLVHIDHVKTLNDFKLLQMGWIFDINFAPTIAAIVHRGYLKKLRDVLPPTQEIDDIYYKVILKDVELCSATFTHNP